MQTRRHHRKGRSSCHKKGGSSCHKKGGSSCHKKGGKTRSHRGGMSCTSKGGKTRSHRGGMSCTSKGGKKMGGGLMKAARTALLPFLLFKAQKHTQKRHRTMKRKSNKSKR